MAEGNKEDYLVRCFSGDYASSDNAIGNDDNLEATCNGLTQGTLYRVTIETRNSGFVMEPCPSECRLTNVTGQ